MGAYLYSISLLRRWLASMRLTAVINITKIIKIWPVFFHNWRINWHADRYIFEYIGYPPSNRIKQLRYFLFSNMPNVMRIADCAIWQVIVCRKNETMFPIHVLNKIIYKTVSSVTMFVINHSKRRRKFFKRKSKKLCVSHHLIILNSVVKLGLTRLMP